MTHPETTVLRDTLLPTYARAIRPAILLILPNDRPAKARRAWLDLAVGIESAARRDLSCGIVCGAGRKRSQTRRRQNYRPRSPRNTHERKRDNRRRGYQHP